MFTAGELSKLMVRPLQIVGLLVVMVFVTGLLVGRWVTLASLSFHISLTCAPIKSPENIATYIWPVDWATVKASEQRTLNLDTCEALSIMLSKSD